MFTPRFEAVRELEEWISSIKFTYVGSSPDKAQQQSSTAVELSNKDDKIKQSDEKNSSNNEKKIASSIMMSEHFASSSLSEQLVEILVKLLQTGMRPGLRGALEVVKVLDRLPDVIYVPVPNTSFSVNQLDKPSRWFKSEEAYYEFFDPSQDNLLLHHQQEAAQQHQASSKRFFMDLPNENAFDLVALPMKFIRSSLFVVNSAASNAFSSSSSTEDNNNEEGDDDDATSSPTRQHLPKSAAAQLRMFLRLCLQQRCLLAVLEILVGYLKGSSDSAGSLAEFLYVHPSASPLLDEMAFPQVLDCIRKFGGPPLIVRASATEHNLSIGPLLESPWDPEVAATIASDSPLTASWSMWFASKGLRLKWNLEFNLPFDNKIPDYVVVESSGLTSLTVGGGGAKNGSGQTPTSAKNNANQYFDAANNENFGDDTGSVTGKTDGGGRRVIRRIVKKRGGNTTSRTTTVVTSPQSDLSARSNQLPPMSPATSLQHQHQQEKYHQRKTSSLIGESPRPLNNNSFNNNTITPREASTGSMMNRKSNSRDLVAAENNDEKTSTMMKNFKFSSPEEISKSIELVNQKKKTEVEFAENTISKLKNNAATFQSSIAESVQPLLEAYAVLVYSKFSSALGKTQLSENRLMECFDEDAGFDQDMVNELLVGHEGDDAQLNYEGDDSDDDDEFDVSKKPVRGEGEDKGEDVKTSASKNDDDNNVQDQKEEEEKDDLAW